MVVPPPPLASWHPLLGKILDLPLQWISCN